MYAVEFSLRAECTKHLKEGYKESNRLSSLRREKLAFGRDGCRTTYTRDVSGLDHPFHVNVMKQSQVVVTNCGCRIMAITPDFQSGDEVSTTSTRSKMEQQKTN